MSKYLWSSEVGGTHREELEVSSPLPSSAVLWNVNVQENPGRKKKEKKYKRFR